MDFQVEGFTEEIRLQMNNVCKTQNCFQNKHVGGQLIYLLCLFHNVKLNLRVGVTHKIYNLINNMTT